MTKQADTDLLRNVILCVILMYNLITRNYNCMYDEMFQEFFFHQRDYRKNEYKIFYATLSRNI